MADKKISALTAASTPLAGTEVLPIVQSGATVKVAVSDLTAGRAISATSVTASTGNFVVGTSGQGIDFSATPGTGTSELLADYEEGTFTATLTPSTSGTLPLISTNDALSYTKIGRVVTITGTVIAGVVSSPIGTSITLNLPFTAANLSETASTIASTFVYFDSPSYVAVIGALGVTKNTSTASLFVNASSIGQNDELGFSFSYLAA
jgi:hypothetical protein